MEGGTVRESLSFSAGAAVSAAVLANTAFSVSTFFHSILLPLSIIPLFIIYKCGIIGTSHATAHAAVFPLLFLCGALCFSTSALTGTTQAANQSSIGVFADKCYEAISTSIDSMPFEKDNTRGLIKALVAGDRSGLSPEIRQAFRDAGASHLLALSGLHLGIIYILISKLLSFSGNFPSSRKFRSLATIILCGLYTLATGASPSLKRAFLFITLRETGLIIGRDTNPLGILNAALIIHIAISPEEITSPGFQLSYLAVLGIITIAPRLQDIWQSEDYLASKIWQLASVSLASQIFTAPVAWLHFGTFPVYFLITNILAIPLTGILMPSAVIAALLHSAGICPQFLLNAVDLLSSLLTGILSTISSLPSAAI